MASGKGKADDQEKQCKFFEAEYEKNTVYGQCRAKQKAKYGVNKGEETPVIKKKRMIKVGQNFDEQIVD